MSKEELPSFDGNTKDDKEKVAMYQGLISRFPRACEHVAIISQGGAKKYDWDGWDKVPDGQTRYRNAEARHEVMEARGEHIDPDHSRYCVVPCLHLGQRVWNLLATLELVLRDQEALENNPMVTIPYGFFHMHDDQVDEDMDTAEREAARDAGYSEEQIDAHIARRNKG